jgi:hypothetical protein
MFSMIVTLTRARLIELETDIPQTIHLGICSDSSTQQILCWIVSKNGASDHEEKTALLAYFNEEI